jgi:hypothetical protein
LMIDVVVRYTIKPVLRSSSISGFLSSNS